jgi:hypothetical protein
MEIDNFRVALDWLFQTLDLDWGLRLCVALFRFCDMREHLTEGRGRLETVLRLAGAERSKERARVSLFLGALATAQGDYPAAEDFLQQSLSLYEELGDQSGIAVFEYSGRIRVVKTTRDCQPVRQHTPARETPLKITLRRGVVTSISRVDAVDFVLGDVTVKPPNVRPHFLQCLQ